MMEDTKFEFDKTGTIITKCISINSDVIIPAGIKEIGKYAFRDCSFITSIAIPDSVTKIGYAAFWGCSSLTSIEIPNSVVTIDKRAFYKCTSLVSIEIPDSVKIIKGGAFSRCTSLVSIKIPDSVKYIDGFAFDGCTSLVSIETSKSISKIGSYTFAGCNSLTSFVIPSNVTTIDSGAFAGCSSLQKIEIPCSVINIDNSAFGGCNSLSIFVAHDNPRYSSLDGVLFSKDRTVIIKFPNTYKGEYIIPDGVTIVEESTFSGCRSLTSIKIPSSVNCIGNNAFEGCDSLNNIFVAPDNNSFMSVNGVLFTKDRTVIEKFPSSHKEGTMILEGVDCVKENAFTNCRFLSTIEIPNGETVFEDSAFYDCAALENIVLSEDSQFSGCSFCNCISIKNISVPPNNPYHIIFDGVVFSKDKRQLIKFMNGLCPTYKVPIETKRINTGAFCCSNIEKIYLNLNVKLIECRSFFSCNKLIEVHLPIENPETITIENNAFQNVENCILYIPIGTENAYRNDDRFSVFKEIKIERIN